MYTNFLKYIIKLFAHAYKGEYLELETRRWRQDKIALFDKDP